MMIETHWLSQVTKLARLSMLITGLSLSSSCSSGRGGASDVLEHNSQAQSPWVIDCTFFDTFECERLTIYSDGSYQVHSRPWNRFVGFSCWEERFKGSLRNGSVSELIALIERGLAEGTESRISFNYSGPGGAGSGTTNYSVHSIQYNYNTTVGSTTVVALDVILDYENPFDGELSKHPQFEDAKKFAEVWNEIRMRCNWKYAEDEAE